MKVTCIVSARCGTQFIIWPGWLTMTPSASTLVHCSPCGTTKKPVWTSPECGARPQRSAYCGIAGAACKRRTLQDAATRRLEQHAWKILRRSPLGFKERVSQSCGQVSGTVFFFRGWGEPCSKVVRSVPWVTTRVCRLGNRYARICPRGRRLGGNATGKGSIRGLIGNFTGLIDPPFLPGFNANPHGVAWGCSGGCTL